MSIMDIGTTVSASWEDQVRAQNANGNNALPAGAWKHVIEGLAGAAERMYLRAEVNETRVKAAEVEAEDRRKEAAEARDLATRMSAELDEFRTQVRDLLAEWVGDGTISKAVAQDAVTQLDLSPLTQKYEVEVRVTLDPVYVTVEVEATDEDQAMDHEDLDDLIGEAVQDRLSVSYDRPGIDEWDTQRAYVV